MRSIINGFSGRVLNPCEHNCSNRPLDNSLQDYFLNTVLLSSTMTVWESILGITGFKKSYNFILFFIFAGGLFGFTLSRLQYLDITGRYASGTAPGEWFHQHTGFRKVGITLHLGTILPCAILLIFQFIPSIRHRAILFHRINRYIIITLFLISNAGALMIARHAFGGGHDVQLAIGLLVLISTSSVGMAYYNIRCLQIEQHRAWMLRAMFYMGSIVTIRPLQEITSRIINKLGTYYAVWSCERSISLGSSTRSRSLSSGVPPCGATGVMAHRCRLATIRSLSSRRMITALSPRRSVQILAYILATDAAGEPATANGELRAAEGGGVCEPLKRWACCAEVWGCGALDPSVEAGQPI
ncbi:conserved hypothetical protein [Histoplasma capsulatum var. duboisii H88]|uniref:DUF2306 domain-containing protein n=1 Tax=Ajellomyces capsulatus (strain H88) TaxID=544711 RepID=F0U665_AJEC8|nr:conserved hypothetical protein [Histoplasma capsulatum var. duboisii H88]